MKIKRAIKAGGPNVNTGKVTVGLEDKLKEFFETYNNTIFVDDLDIAAKYPGDYSVLFSARMDRCIGTVTGFDEEYFYIDITGYGETLFDGHIVDDEITGYTMGVVYAVDGDTYTTCSVVHRLNLIKSDEEDTSDAQ